MVNAFLALIFAVAAVSDTEVWNEGVDYYRAGDVTNAIRVLKPLMLSKSHGARAAELVAKLEYDRGNIEESAAAAHLALRANPKDGRTNRNFTRATDRLPELREQKRIEGIMKSAQGKDAGAMMREATMEARKLLETSGTYRTNSAERAVMLSDSLSKWAEKLADVWLPLREMISSSVTNQEQAATIISQLEQSEEKTRRAAIQLGDFDGEAYSILSEVEGDFTRFFKLVAMPPQAIDEDIIAQSNAYLDVEAVNGRNWQQEALDFTRAFRAKFPAWARAYEQQAQSDTNKPPFTAEDQAKISALATEVEKLQLECAEKNLPPSQEKASNILLEIKSLLPKDNNGQNGQNGQNQQNAQQPPQQDKQDDKNDKDKEPPKDEGEDQQQPNEQEAKEAEQGEEDKQNEQDESLDAVLQKAQERNDEHEANKKLRMRKSQLPPNERDW